MFSALGDFSGPMRGTPETGNPLDLVFGTFRPVPRDGRERMRLGLEEVRGRSAHPPLWLLGSAVVGLLEPASQPPDEEGTGRHSGHTVVVVDAVMKTRSLAAGIRRVKGVRRIGVRLGNWLTPGQGRRLLEQTASATPRGLRDYAMVAMLIGCGLRRGELLALTVDSIQDREEHWVIAALVGKGGHVRTVPIPTRVKAALDAWTATVGSAHGPVFRAINKAGRVWGNGMSPKVLWDVVPNGSGSRRHREAGAA